MGGCPTSVSVVVNTLDRVESLRHLLEVLPVQTHEDLEVVVVHGPCADGTEQMLESFADRIKVLACPQPNLSMSRNIGIAAAAGDVVAFIDDDGLPEPIWLEELVKAYADPEVGAVGGFVLDHTGHAFQARHLLSDRLGNTELCDEVPAGDFCFPGSFRFPTMLGCNSSFRRDVLLDVGGFDEEYEYYLDETDVCLRVVDAGHRILIADRAVVHHKYLPSGLRNHSKVVTDNAPVIKNKVYFSLVNGLEHSSWTDTLADDLAFAHVRRSEMLSQHQAGNLDKPALDAALVSIERGWEAGIRRGMEGRRALLGPEHLKRHGAAFLRLETLDAPDRLRLVFITRTLPPASPGGVGRFMLDMGTELAARGHDIRIITTGEGHDTVDLEDGVWVHRVVKATPPGWVAGDDPPIPDVLRPNADAVAAEVLRIQSERPVDFVLSSIWDVEHAEVFGTTSVPIVTSFVTPFSVVHATQPETVGLDDASADAIRSLERWAIRTGHAFQACGDHVIAKVSDAAGIELDPAGTVVVPLGSPARAGAHQSGPTRRFPAAPGGVAPCRITYFGRFEPRKGIDLLLAALPDIVRRAPEARITLAGRDDLPDGLGGTFRSAFEAAHPDLVASGAVRFLGEVDDAGLDALLADSDVAVLPSRFESFGLVYVEAMAAGVPVVAVAGSGAEGVVEPGRSGVVVPAEPGAIAEALVGLAADPAARAQLGAGARAAYLERFTVSAMADRFLDLFSAIDVERIESGAPWSNSSEALPLPDGTLGAGLVSGETVALGSASGRTSVVLCAPTGVAARVRLLDPNGSVPLDLVIPAGRFTTTVVPDGWRAVAAELLDAGPAAVAAVIRVRAPGARR